MRLRKNMKRAAAAALALSMALSVAAPAALAKDYYIDDGDITVTVTEEGETYVRVGKAEEERDETEVVIKGGKNPNKPAENNSDGSADEAEGQKPVVDAEPGASAENTGTELIVWPESVKSGEAQKKDGPEPADAEPKTPDTQKPEGKTDAATLEASTEQKPVEKAAEDDDDDKDVMTFEANTANTVTKAVNEAVKHIIKIINNYTKKDTTVTIENVNIDVSKDNKAALSVKGEGDTTLKLEGDNTLKSGNGYAGVEKNDNTSSGKLTITADSNQNTLMAVGGSGGAGIGSDNNNSTSKLGITGGTITATGGNYSAGIGGGIRGNADVTITGNAVIKKAQGNYNGAGIGGGGVGNGTVTISGNAVVEEAVGGTSERGGAGIGGGGWKDGDVTISGNAKVDAQGGTSAAGIGGGGSGSGTVKISGNVQVSAKGGKAGDQYKKYLGDGASIGSGGYSSNNKPTGTPVGGEEIELDFSDMTGGFVARIDGKTESGHTHNWKEISRVAATQDSAGEVEYFCKGCGSTSVKILPVMQPAAEENSSDAAIVLTVTAAPTYEMYLENARYIVTADSDTAILSGRLGNLADLKAQGADTLVFRTKSRETALDIDAMLSLGVEDTLFALTHSGSSATLTVGGVEHNELL
jgi:hypothetical protein